MTAPAGFDTRQSPMPRDAQIQKAVRRYFRRKFAIRWDDEEEEWTGDLEGLKAAADQYFREASDTVTLTSTSSEGGSADGEITCPKILLLDVIEDLIEEIDPDYRMPAQRASGYVLQFGGYGSSGCN